MGFRSGDWLGHSRTLRCFLRSHSLVVLHVCFWWLSSWKTQPRPIFNALTEGRGLLAKISRYMPLSILPSMRCSRPVPIAEKYPQTMMFPPPCFMVGMVYSGLYKVFILQCTQGPAAQASTYPGLDICTQRSSGRRSCGLTREKYSFLA